VYKAYIYINIIIIIFYCYCYCLCYDYYFYDYYYYHCYYYCCYCYYYDYYYDIIVIIIMTNIIVYIYMYHVIASFISHDVPISNGWIFHWRVISQVIFSVDFTWQWTIDNPNWLFTKHRYAKPTMCRSCSLETGDPGEKKTIFMSIYWMIFQKHPNIISKWLRVCICIFVCGTMYIYIYISIYICIYIYIYIHVWWLNHQCWLISHLMVVRINFCCLCSAGLGSTFAAAVEPLEPFSCGATAPGSTCENWVGWRKARKPCFILQ
jgi:hypothetical protein